MAAFDPDQWLQQTAPPQSGGAGFDPDQWLANTDDYWGDVKKHAIEGVKEFPAAMGQMAGQVGKVGRGLLPGSVVESAAQVIQGAPVGETPIGEAGKAAYQLGKGAVGGVWQGIKDTGSLLKSGAQYAIDDELPFAETEIGQKFRERPISVPLGIVGTAAGAYGGLKGFQAMRGGAAIPKGVPGEMGAIPEGGIPPPEAGVPPSGGAVPPPTTPLGHLENFAKQFGEKMKPKVDDTLGYINRTGNTWLGKPGRIADLADLSQESSQMMAVKSMGGSPLYVTQGIRAGKTPTMLNNELRAIGQYALDNKIVVPELGNKVMLATQEALQNKAGVRIGGVRMMADEMAPAPATYAREVVNNVHNQIGSQYLKGLPGAREYQMALKIVRNHKPTYEGMADAATELNKLANKANRNHQPHTPFTDVANAISEMNNARISEIVGPEVAKVYDTSLKEFGVNKKIQTMLGRKVGQGLHRTGPGSMTRAAYQKFMDEIGYKGGARVLNRLSGKIMADPSMASNLPELFKSFINEVVDVLPEEGAGMAHGGIVGEMDAYLTPKYGGVQ